MTAPIYAPKTDIVSKLRRRASRYVVQRAVTPSLERGIISLSFDDCPRSVTESALPLIESKGWKATIYASLGLCNVTNHLGLHMSEQDILDAHKAGHEIGDHTFSHIDGLRAHPSEVLADIHRNRDQFSRLGLPAAKTFAYPYGEVTPRLKQTLSKEFDLLRGIHTPNNGTVDLNLAASARLYSSEMSQTRDLIQDAAEKKHWLILFGHDVRENPSDFGCTQDELLMILDFIHDLGLNVLPVKEALKVIYDD